VPSAMLERPSHERSSGELLPVVRRKIVA
jgi:hypothetical protein